MRPVLVNLGCLIMHPQVSTLERAPESSLFLSRAHWTGSEGNRSIGWDIGAGQFSPELRRRGSWAVLRGTCTNMKILTGGDYMPDRSATKIESALRLNLSPEQHQNLAVANHWMVGLLAGAGDALARRRLASADRGQGLVFGLAFWIGFDELFTVATGVARRPQDYPWQAHARGLVGHVAFGVVADSTLDILDRVA